MRWQPEEPDIRMVKLIMSMCTGVLMCNGVEDKETFISNLRMMAYKMEAPTPSENE